MGASCSRAAVKADIAAALVLAGVDLAKCKALLAKLAELPWSDIHTTADGIMVDLVALLADLKAGKFNDAATTADLMARVDQLIHDFSGLHASIIGTSAQMQGLVAASTQPVTAPIVPAPAPASS